MWILDFFSWSIKPENIVTDKSYCEKCFEKWKLTEVKYDNLWNSFCDKNSTHNVTVYYATDWEQLMEAIKLEKQNIITWQEILEELNNNSN